jgi:hypothetical protein
MLTISLDIRGFEILTAFPVVNLSSRQKEKEKVKISNLGLMYKMAGAAAIESMTTTTMENGKALLQISLKALGILGLSFLSDIHHSPCFFAPQLTGFIKIQHRNLYL